MSPPKKNLAETIFEQLRGQILRDELEAGERLPPERELAAALGTNRNTLREAIRRLEQANLVSVRHGQGVTVADFRTQGTIELLGPFLAHGIETSERIRALFDILMARAQVLEMAVALAADRGNATHMAALQELRAQQLEAYEARDREALVAGDLAMIQVLVDAASSLTVRWIANTLLRVYETIVGRAKSLWVISDDFPEYLETVVDAIAAGDADTAVMATRRYYQQVDQALLKTIHALRGQTPAPAPASPTPDEE